MQTTAANQRATAHEVFSAGGAVCRFSTNSPDILEAARGTFLPADPERTGDAFYVDIIVTSNDPAERPWPRPCFRGLEHMVMASFGPRDVLLFNQLTRRVQGRISPRLAQDRELWQNTILPLMVGTMGPVCGLTPLHCACLAKHGEGILLAGRSGTGKSTLAYALARSGFEFLSDDWTYFSRQQSEITAWGLPLPAKLLLDATRFFPELHQHQPMEWLNGESAISADPATPGARRSLQCVPRRIFILERRILERRILERRGDATAEFLPLAWEKTLQWFESGVQQLPASLAKFRAEQLRTIQLLAERECWVLRFSGSPAEVAQALAKFCANGGGNSRLRPASPRHMDARVPDLLRRFTPTPLQCDLRVGQTIVALETNSPALLGAIRELASIAHHALASSGIRWRLVADTQLGVEHDPAAFANGAMPCITFSGGGFLAFDEQHRTGIGFLPARALQRKQFVRTTLLPAMSSLLRKTSHTTEAA